LLSELVSAIFADKMLITYQQNYFVDFVDKMLINLSTHFTPFTVMVSAILADKMLITYQHTLHRSL
jgi:sorbitol-specific phosphotransferase system component IIA